KSVLDAVIIPNAGIFGYLIEVGELLVGIGLIATAAILLVKGQSLSVATLRAVLGVVALSAVAGAFMNLNFSLFGGTPRVWSLASDACNEGISIDGVMMLI